jgi:hypothetical protein
MLSSEYPTPYLQSKFPSHALPHPDEVVDVHSLAVHSELGINQ